MIKHHPKFSLIQAFVNGDVPASLSVGIAIHADMCSVCQQKIAQITEQMAEISFEQDSPYQSAAADATKIVTNASFDFNDMIDDIVQLSILQVNEPKEEKTITFKDSTYTLPLALHHTKLSKTARIGKLARTRIQFDEGEIHSSLLRIEPGGAVPEHTHKGFELTVLLSGSFHDDSGEYVEGDFIMLEGSKQHHPISTDGCLCYTVANDALHFTQGINKLLNPIGSFIY